MPIQVQLVYNGPDSDGRHTASRTAIDVDGEVTVDQLVDEVIENNKFQYLEIRKTNQQVDKEYEQPL